MRSLLERLARADRRRSEAESATLESIRANLQIILGSVRGISPSAPELGIVSLAFIELSQETIRPLEKDLQRMIEDHEPRLTGVSVRFAAPDGGSTRLLFEIRAQLRGQSRSTLFRTAIQHSGRVDVRYR